MAQSELRQRYQATSATTSESTNVSMSDDDAAPLRSRGESVTELPILQANGQPAMERTQIPSPKNTSSSSSSIGKGTMMNNNTKTLSSQDSITSLGSSKKSGSGGNGNQTQQQVAKSEGKKRKIAIRVITSVLMIGTFLGLMYMGHVYICLLVALVEVLLFRELVKVRYSAYFNTIQDTIPFFRTTQWLWFAVAIFYTYGDFFREIVIQGNPEFHPYGYQYAHYLPSLSFLLYSGTFVMTIATMQVGHIKFQLNQLCWTIVVLCLTVGQLKYIMHNIFNGLFWFALPILLVVTNDIMAYVCGMTCGRKFIRRKFIRFSPNKTWEGFIGGWMFTMFSAWYISKLLAHFPWMYCPTNKFELFPEALDCNPDPIFVPSLMTFPAQMFDILPRSLSKMIPNVVEICSLANETSTKAGVVVDTYNTNEFSDLVLTPCVSGNKLHVHHHFEYFVNVFPVQMHALVLALFASLVAPFGGFLASAIKRAYRLKDFDSLIPGHGGVMDRMDCQFLMALCTWVHYNTFVKIATISVPKLTYMYNQLSDEEKKMFLQSISLAGRGKRIRLDEYGF